MDKDETITNEFNFKYLLYMFGGGILILLIGILLIYIYDSSFDNSKYAFLGTVGIILSFVGFLTIVSGVINFMALLPSLFNFSLYIRKKRRYYENLESAIKKSKNYEDFFENFYR
jgi:uncharacterized membrane protein